MNFIIYVLPLIVFFVILLIKKSDGINKKSILLSLVILLGAIVLSQALTYLSKFVFNVVNDSTAQLVVAILIDVVLQGVIIFVETFLYKKVFGVEGKIHFGVYAILICCIILSAVLYYIDYRDMFSVLNNGMDSSSFLGMATMYQPRFVILRNILAVIPAIAVIVGSFVKMRSE